MLALREIVSVGSSDFFSFSLFALKMRFNLMLRIRQSEMFSLSVGVRMTQPHETLTFFVARSVLTPSSQRPNYACKNSFAIESTLHVDREEER